MANPPRDTPASREPETAGSVRASVVVKLLQLIGYTALALYALFFVLFMGQNFSALVDREEAALESFQTSVGDSPRPQPTGLTPRAPANQGQTVTDDGGGGDVLTPDLPPWLWLLLSIFFAIWLTFVLVKSVPKTIQRWKKWSRCKWKKSVLSFLACVLETFWVVMTTLVDILVAVLVVLAVIINIAALVRVLIA
jgi:hypothetical protein